MFNKCQYNEIDQGRRVTETTYDTANSRWVGLNQDKMTHRAAICSATRKLFFLLFPNLMEHMTLVMAYMTWRNGGDVNTQFRCHNKRYTTCWMSSTVTRDFHQIENWQIAEVSCLFTSSVISREREKKMVWGGVGWEDGGKEKVWVFVCMYECGPICTRTLTTTTNKWAWFITSFLLSMNSVRAEGVN